MLKILQEISKKTLLLNEGSFAEEQRQTRWLGYPPATAEAISAAERRLRVTFPEDYVEFLLVSNGFSQTVASVNCSFLPVEKIDYLKVFDEDLIEIWEENDLEEVAIALRRSILVGGLGEEQYFLLIPPADGLGWRYWKFASWIPGEQPYDSLKAYWNSELDFLKSQTKGLKAPKPKPTIDFSLRDAAFQLDWLRVYGIAEDFISGDKRYNYFNGSPDVVALMLLAAGKCERLHRFTDFLQSLKAKRESGEKVALNDHLLNIYGTAAEQGLWFVPTLQLRRFTSKENPINLAMIEEQIHRVRKDLLKEKNRLEKIGYQLYFLFDHGSADGFIQHYEQHQEDLIYSPHLQAAVVYTSQKDYDKARVALNRYWKTGYAVRPLDPFLNEDLLPLWDEPVIGLH